MHIKQQTLVEVVTITVAEESFSRKKHRVNALNQTGLWN